MVLKLNCCVMKDTTAQYLLFYDVMKLVIGMILMLLVFWVIFPYYALYFKSIVYHIVV
jgi:hypothetical protein